ncbi:hypothetical protein ACFSWE_08605 [Leucobacter albus]|uniref:Uncharacterized protein n=1 Tax=Leucobacter albus TaxID=272210 RepID=A0ABW3TQG1_9MICO
MAKIREDFEGAVHVDGFVLVAGDEVPEGVRIGAHLTGVEPAPVEDPDTDEDPDADEGDFDPLAEEPAPAKPRGRPKKVQ